MVLILDFLLAIPRRLRTDRFPRQFVPRLELARTSGRFCSLVLSSASLVRLC